MADEAKNGFEFPGPVGKFLLEPLNHAIAAGTRQALKQGVQAHELVEMHLNHLASVVAMIEPPAARELMLRKIVEDFAPMVGTHVNARYTTPGGIKLPRPVDSVMGDR